MTKRISQKGTSKVVGLDVGDRESAVAILDWEGEELDWSGKVETTREGLASSFRVSERYRVVLEVGTHTPWIARQLEAWGHEVIVANPRRLSLITQNLRKGDDEDAELLARLGRSDLRLIRPVEVRTVEAQEALAYVATIGDPERFARSRDVGAYLGMVPRRAQSGDRDPSLPITKAGDKELRRLLVLSAHYILGPFGEECELRRFGQCLIERGGSGAKKIAVVAVARKLAVLLLALWKSGEVYEPLRSEEPAA